MCLFPIRAWQTCDVDTGQVRVVFKRPFKADVSTEITLPCGKCVECLQYYSNEWATRCMLEASLYDKSCMITLTYKDAPFSVSRRHIQLFIKRLRRRLEPLKVRYFGCGEYGKKGGRPHYHLIVFGWRPDDLERFFQRDGHWVYKSHFVADVWFGEKDKATGKYWWSDLSCKPGFISVEDVTFQSCRYTAKYLQKLQTLSLEQAPPFTCMSLKPGIGLDAFKESWLESDSIYLGGRTYSVPRYFRRKFTGDFTRQAEQRKLRGKLLSQSLLDRRKAAIQRFGQIRL